jgi:CHAD domain-containing protein
MNYRIESGENPGTAIRRIVREQLEHALRTTAALGGTEEAEATHSIRKRIKKIRAVLRLVRKEIGPDVYREENQRLKRAAQCFSSLRDASVQSEVIETLRQAGGLEPGAFGQTVMLMTWQWQDATGDQTGAQREAVAILEALADRLEGWPLDQLTLDRLCRAFQRTYRKARKCLHYVLDHRTPENFHSWRKGTKNIWYQARILQELKPTVICEISAAADKLGEHLGNLHDLAFLREQLKDCVSAPAGEKEVLIGLICTREKALEQIAIDLGGRFFAEKPGAFGRRLLRYAEDWPPVR